MDKRFVVQLGLVLVAAFGLRMLGVADVLPADGPVQIHDLDTMRRLARLEATAAADTYPVVEVRDGFPEGTVSHWTRPFDWTLLALDAVCAPLVPRAKRHEAGAVFAGPVLGTLGVALFLACACRMLGRGLGLVAGALYAVQYPLLQAGAVGNGDHQNLQHLCLLAFAWLSLRIASGTAHRGHGVAAGIALGLAIWVSTESLLVFALAAAGALLHPRRCQILAAASLVATLLAGIAVEQRDPFAVEWDKVSLFQLYPAAVLLAALLATLVLRPWLAFLVVLPVAVAVPFANSGWTSPDELARTQVWLQSAVTEYRSSFFAGTGFSLREGLRRFSPLLLLFPLLLAGVGFARDRPLPFRAALAGIAAATFGFAAYEVKLGHLFAIFWPIVVVVGGARLLQSVPARWLRRGLVALAAAAVLGHLCCTAPAGLDEQARIRDAAVRELCDWLDDQPGAQAHSVLAPWELGAPLLYHTRWPVVASGYHRNLAGIADGYRCFLAQQGEIDTARAILAARRVRYVVAWYSRSFFHEAPLVLGDARVFLDRAAGRFTDLARNSLFWRLRYGSVPGLRRVHEGLAIELPSTPAPEPMYTVFRVE